MTNNAAVGSSEILLNVVEAYDLPDATRSKLISVSENATYLMETDSPIAVLRLYRAGYQSEASIRSELCWISSLREQSVVKTPAVIATRSGDAIHSVRNNQGATQYCALFEFMSGQSPNEDDLDTVRTVGLTAARLHDHVAKWMPPSWYTRFTWDIDSILGAEPRWGRWQDGLNIDHSGRKLLESTEESVRRGLADYAMTPANSGLIHGDLRAANLLETSDGDISVIDFDDCGFSWFLWDLCSTTTFIEHKPGIEDTVHGWLQGYEEVRKLPSTDRRMIPHLVVLRRLHLLAWIGSHQASDPAREFGAEYTAATYDVANKYLRGEFLAL